MTKKTLRTKFFNLAADRHFIRWRSIRFRGSEFLLFRGRAYLRSGFCFLFGLLFCCFQVALLHWPALAMFVVQLPGVPTVEAEFTQRLCASFPFISNFLLYLSISIFRLGCYYNVSEWSFTSWPLTGLFRTACYYSRWEFHQNNQRVFGEKWRSAGKLKKCPKHSTVIHRQKWWNVRTTGRQKHGRDG